MLKPESTKTPDFAALFNMKFYRQQRCWRLAKKEPEEQNPSAKSQLNETYDLKTSVAGDAPTLADDASSDTPPKSPNATNPSNQSSGPDFVLDSNFLDMLASGRDLLLAVGGAWPLESPLSALQRSLHLSISLESLQLSRELDAAPHSSVVDLSDDAPPDSVGLRDGSINSSLYPLILRHACALRDLLQKVHNNNDMEVSLPPQPLLRPSPDVSPCCPDRALYRMLDSRQDIEETVDTVIRLKAGRPYRLRTKK